MVRLSAESFFEKAEDRSPCAGSRREKIQASEAPPWKRLDQTQFHYQRVDPIAIYETFPGADRPALVSEGPARPDLHHLDRPRLVSDPDPRYECVDRSDLVDVAQRD